MRKHRAPGHPEACAPAPVSSRPPPLPAPPCSSLHAAGPPPSAPAFADAAIELLIPRPPLLPATPLTAMTCSLLLFARDSDGHRGFPCSSVGGVCLQSGRLRFDPWAGKIPWKRNGNPLQYSCLGKPHGQRSLAGHSPRGHKEVDMTEQLNHHHRHLISITIWFKHQSNSTKTVLNLEG